MTFLHSSPFLLTDPRDRCILWLFSRVSQASALAPLPFSNHHSPPFSRSNARSLAFFSQLFFCFFRFSRTAVFFPAPCFFFCPRFRVFDAHGFVCVSINRPNFPVTLTVKVCIQFPFFFQPFYATRVSAFFFLLSLSQPMENVPDDFKLYSIFLFARILLFFHPPT